MYNIKGPSKIVAKTARRGISQSMENYRDHSKNKITDEDENISQLVPKPVFQKKMGPTNNKHENVTPEHIELIKYIHESWTAVCSELEQENEESSQNSSDVVQLRNEDQGNTRSQSKINLGANFSTTSLVNLQYKYEELIANYRGLLKILELKNNDIKKYINENTKLHEENQKLAVDLNNSKDNVVSLERKMAEMKRKKHEKMSRLKAERHTLAVVHNRLVALLHRQCMEKNEFIDSLLKVTPRSEKGLLLQEIRKNNILTYKNFQQHQELEYLRALLRVSRTDFKDSETSSRKSVLHPG